MSLGDYLRLLRARKGGVTPMEIEDATGLTPGLYRQMEQRYRAVGDDASLASLAEYFGVPIEDLSWRLEWPRKSLSRALVAATRTDEPLTLFLWNGEQLTGHVAWWDLGATELLLEEGRRIVVQRHAVERWDPRGPEPEIGGDDGVTGDAD